jgi:glycerol kinase
VTVVLGLDQGTSSTRCVAVDEHLAERAAAQVPVRCAFPRPGWVEQDPDELAESARQVIARAGGGAVALGIANQTETFVVWQRGSGRPIHPAIVWQDRRTAPVAADPAVRARTGLELDATFPATKLAWLLDHVPGARAAAEAGELAYGDVACWLLFTLTGAHVTDAGNAGRTLLCPLGGTDWDDALLGRFGIPRALLPPIVDSDGLDHACDGIPIRAAAGDQQASLFGLGCRRPGEAKVTLGTGAFLLVHAGTTAPDPPPGVLASTAWRRAGTTTYALEGFVPTAGAAVDWFAGLGALPPATQLDALLREGDDDPGVICVPALQGTGVPSWNAGAAGTVLGLRLGTTRAQLARAVVDGVLHQVVDGLEAIGGVATLRLDGGLARSPWIAQRLADLAGVRVERAARPDSTALGAAILAGRAAGVWDTDEAVPALAPDLVAEPAMAEAARADRRERWAHARAIAEGHAPGRTSPLS